MLLLECSHNPLIIEVTWMMHAGCIVLTMQSHSTAVLEQQPIDRSINQCSYAVFGTHQQIPTGSSEQVE